MDPRSVEQVTVVDIRMPFFSMVILMVKWAVASIPAFLILTVLGSLVFGILGAVMGGLFGGFQGGMHGGPRPW